MGLERTPAAIIAAMHYSAADHAVPEGERAFRRLLAEIVGEVDIEAEGLGPICSRGMLCKLSQLCVATCFLGGSRTAVRHPGQAEPAGDILMVRAMEGPLIVRQGGREVAAGPGELVFLAASVAYEWDLPLGGRIDCARLPASAMRMADGQLGRVLLRSIPRDFPPLQLLVTYGAYLLMRGPHSVQEAEMAQTHFNELLPLVTGYLKAPVPDARARRLARIKADIDAHLAHPDLTAAMIARMHGVTPRYIQRLLQEEGTTFSRVVLDRRLAAARRMIEQPGDRRPISAVAYEVGFGDLSYFNRAFRQRYGEAPSAVRAAVA
ncbi:AraC-like DNA-binding protein [Stella humosa]|uniref:AraC-like DNA-binding protein n=1 Tax=Stella humosa TaxID=94 RepID=A0A3N1KWR7_9PROT|nr:AraC family transcriptional regulator [Stella humosa]ROP83912.1 AraC-like DNA-binding protein [Stella humosa]BBK32826.1 transcriptional activator RhrA [Stella humosa]